MKRTHPSRPSAWHTSCSPPCARLPGGVGVCGWVREVGGWGGGAGGGVPGRWTQQQQQAAVRSVGGPPLPHRGGWRAAGRRTGPWCKAWGPQTHRGRACRGRSAAPATPAPPRRCPRGRRAVRYEKRAVPRWAVLLLGPPPFPAGVCGGGRRGWWGRARVGRVPLPPPLHTPSRPACMQGVLGGGGVGGGSPGGGGEEWVGEGSRRRAKARAQRRRRARPDTWVNDWGGGARRRRPSLARAGPCTPSATSPPPPAPYPHQPAERKCRTPPP